MPFLALRDRSSVGQMINYGLIWTRRHFITDLFHKKCFCNTNDHKKLLMRQPLQIFNTPLLITLQFAGPLSQKKKSDNII